MMAVIFWFSSQPSSALPYFDWADKVIKKSGHVLGYALLAASYWYGFERRTERRLFSWLFAICYAVTDEFHQSFVPGRSASIWDVLIFDALGAAMGLWIFGKVEKMSQMLSNMRQV